MIHSVEITRSARRNNRFFPKMSQAGSVAPPAMVGEGCLVSSHNFFLVEFFEICDPAALLSGLNPADCTPYNGN